MMDLAALQKAFQTCLLKSSCEFSEVISTEKVSAGIRLEVYVNAYYSRLIEALASNYPIMQKFLGEEKFCELGVKYAKLHPSKYRSIRWFGDQFTKFLQAQKQKQHLIELAQFEWALTEVFDAPEAVVATVSEITVIPPEKWGEMKFVMHPSVRRLDFVWNVVSIWQAISDQQTIPLLQRSQHPTPWVCWRHELVNKFCSLSKEEGWALDAAIKGAAFADICEGLCHWIPQKDIAVKASGYLKGWVQAGLVSSVI